MHILVRLIEFSKNVSFLIFKTKLFKFLFLELLLCEADFDDKGKVLFDQFSLSDLGVDQAWVEQTLVKDVPQLDKESSSADIVGKNDLL